MNDTEWHRMSNILHDERAVARDVAEERGYRPYETGVEWVRDLYPGVSNQQWAATLGRLLRGFDGHSSDGILIPKHPVPGGRPILPQLRPDHPFPIWLPEVHDHADYPPRARKGHEAGKKHDYRAVRFHGEHKHEKDPRYLLAPRPVTTVYRAHAHGPRTHPGHFRHADDRPNRERQREHEAQQVGHHSRERRAHEHRHRVKEGPTVEQRIDLHPRSLRLLEQDPHRRAFFSIEGTIKADALLSKDEASFAVPSVTMWPAPELRRFARRYLRGRRVYVVPDADWHTNAMVALQAWVCVDALRGQKVNAAVAASPELKGIDDHLAAGGSVGEMVVYRRELTRGFHEWARKVRARRIGDVRARDRLVVVTGWLAMHADDSGIVAKPGRTIARYAHLSLDQLDRTIAWMHLHPSHLEDLLDPLFSPPPFTVERVIHANAWDRDGWLWSTFEVREELRTGTDETTVAADSL